MRRRGQRQPRAAIGALLVAAAALLAAGCTSSEPTPSQTTGPAPSGTVPPSAPSTAAPPSGVQPTGTPTVIASGLTSPWSILRLAGQEGSAGGSTLISERDTGRIKEVTPEGEVRVAGTVPGVVHAGEGGLLGIAARHAEGATFIYAYLTTASDNRIVRMRLEGAPGGYSLGGAESILTGLAKAANHDGGRIAFGPDGMLYATVGDAGQPSRAQDRESLNGKILRMTPDGGVPGDNPFPGSLVYSMGHRNPQGLAWDADGRLWAAEFGQNTWDELNRIEPGGNYGWPVVEGIGHREDYIDPMFQWPTSEASPSGLAYVDGTFFLAALRGQRLWAIQPGTGSSSGAASDSGDATAWFEGDYGRLRDAVPGPDGTLWVLTNNTDGRGQPRAGDDKLLQIELAPR